MQRDGVKRGAGPCAERSGRRVSALPGEPAPRYLLDLGGVLMRMRIGARPVVLSACGSGLSGTASPDEVVGLPTGLLQAGAAAVVAPPGEVPDATALPLTTDFRDR